VTQKGSLVEEDKLRFDFSHTKSVDGEILTKVENEVNNMILQNAETSTRLMTPDEAIKAGAMALFGEKYGDEVRVVSMGIDCDEHFDDYYSVELCGGTHVRKTGDIGLFKITSESSVASGVRRIEAITGMAVIEYLREKEDILAQAASRLKAAPSDLVSRISAISDELKKNAQELSELRKAKALGGGLGAGSSSDGANGIGNQPEKINGTNFIGKVFAGVPAKDLKPLVDELKNQVKSGVVVAVTDDGGKASVVIGVTADLTGKYNASELIKLATSAVGGAGGGGRPDMAQGGGADISNLQAAISAVRELIV
jgi:alanyl-tRNA synthetase